MKKILTMVKFLKTKVGKTMGKVVICAFPSGGGKEMIEKKVLVTTC